MAGYVGVKDAAPILIEMLKKQEGFEGGYSSGIATLHEGKIYYAKVVGDTDRLVSLTEASRLPGKIGIIHSRSLGREGDEWAHPFVAEKNGKIETAYVANGGQGFFAKERPRLEKRAEELIGLGYGMRSRSVVPGTRYPTLSDGTSVHMSDLMCQEIQYHMDLGLCAPEAMDTAFHSIPGEITGLLLTLSEPDSIAWSRINMPMWVGFSSHGAYMATSALAFPEDSGNALLLPGSASGRVYADRYEVIPYKTEPCNVARINPEIAHAAYDIIYGMLEEGNKKYSEFYTAIKECFPAADCIDSEPLTYGILQAVAKRGKLKIENLRVPGISTECDAPQSRFSLIK